MIQIVLCYDGDRQVEHWVEGPHAAAGVVLDALLGHVTRPPHKPRLEAVEIVTNARDVPIGD